MKAAALFAGLLLSGCVVHLQTNAPGTIDPSQPPRQIEVKGVEIPDDPGEHVAVIRSGGYALAGGLFDQEGARADRAVAHFGVELSLSLFELDESHTERDHNPLWFGKQERAEGGGLPVDLNLGWTFVALNPDTEAVELGPVYVEVQRDFDWIFPAGIAGGVAVDPVDGRFGPQVSAWFMSMFARVSWLVGGDVAVMGGVVLKFPTVITWSR